MDKAKFSKFFSDVKITQKISRWPNMKFDFKPHVYLSYLRSYGHF